MNCAACGWSPGDADRMLPFASEGGFKMGNVVVEAGVLRLIRAGGPYSLVILSIGLVTMLWGVVNLLRQASSHQSVILQAFVALMPAIIGLYGTFAGYESFMAMAGAEIAPKPADLGSVIAQSMACG